MTMEKKPGIYTMGRCYIITAIEGGRWHLSISTQNALPSYHELKKARYKYCPGDITMAELFPPLDKFVNAHPFCRHLWQVPVD